MSSLARLAFLGLACCTASGAAMADTKAPEVVHNAKAQSSIADSVVVPFACTTVYLSGMVAWTPGEERPKGLHDTESQTAATLDNIRAELAKLGLDLPNVVMMRATLVADPAIGNKIDFAGYTRAYKRYFGTAEQPNKPARATYEGKLVAPDLLIEIEVIAAGKCNTPTGAA